MKIALVQTSDRLINQLQHNIKQAVEPPFVSPNGTFIASLTGCATTPQGSVSWEAGLTSCAVTLSLPRITGTSNSVAATLTGLPAELWPATDQYVVIPTYDNGTVAMSLAKVASTGLVTIYKSAALAAFTNTGTKGIAPCCVTYVRGL